MHKSKLVRQCEQSYGSKLKLFFLPPYSPELNPDEQVWHDLKSNAIGRSEIVSREDLEHKVNAHLEALRKGCPRRFAPSFSYP